MLQEIGRIAVFIICAQTLLHFRAKESYEKYIKLLISMMVLLLLLKPFLNAGGDEKEDFFTELVAGYEKELGKDVFFDLGQEEVEAVVMSMASEAVIQEEMEETAVLQESGATEVAEEKEEVSNIIQVEKIQIGE